MNYIRILTFACLTLLIPACSSLSTSDAREVQVIQVGDTFRLILPADQLFYPGTANLKSSSTLIFREVGKLMRHYQVVGAQVIGYTNDQQTEELNRAVSQKQAQQVAAMLWKQVPMSFISTRGQGAQDPIANAQSLKGQQQNRRVEIRF